MSAAPSGRTKTVTSVESRDTVRAETAAERRRKAARAEIRTVRGIDAFT
jgi:hypothetical protein